MKKISVLISVLLITFGFTLTKCTFIYKGDVPRDGVVPNEATAIKIAEAIWLPVYGEEIFDKQPFVASYNKAKGCWFVNGTLPDNMLGGVPEIEIRKKDGKIIYLNHGQ